MPSTMMRPCWCSSSRLMQRIMVDLPEPDGPQITIRSLLVTRRLMSRSTWKSPYHLCTPIMSTATPVFERRGLELVCVRSAVPSTGPPQRLSPAASRASTNARIARHAVAEDQIEDRGEGIAGGAGHRRRPFRIDARRLDGHQEIEDADDEHQRRVLEQADGGVDDVRDGDLQRLRQDDEPHHLPVAQAHRHRGLILALAGSPASRRAPPRPYRPRQTATRRPARATACPATRCRARTAAASRSP